ncbi:MAG TPA: flagellar motor switch protein FliM [Candidatus Ozemobacteraceae bacterium]|nr:flagellar motor switch protein FliM [Candidatus Ozemobacteraceae bacterium]
MVETLSQSEIDALLSALSTTGTSGGDAPPPPPSGAAESGGARPSVVPGTSAPSAAATAVAMQRLADSDSKKKGKIYDFKRQTKFSKEQLGTIQLIHETFARLVGTYLSTQLRAYAQATIISVDQLTFEEFIRSIYSPTFITGFRSEKLDGKALMDINLNIVFTILDRLLGGSGTPLSTLRQLTEIEIQIMQRIVGKLLNALREAWINVVDLTPAIEFIESNPQFAQIVPPGDMVLSIVVEVKIHDVTGLMNLCIPYNTVEAIAPKLNAASWFAAIRKEPLTKNVETITQQVRVVELPVIAELGTATLTLQDILNLQVGDILLIDRLVKEELDIRVGNQIKFRGRPGVLGKKMAISINQVIQPDEEDKL